MRRDRSLVQRALAGHSAVGVLIGAALYIVCLSGAVAVLQEHLTASGATALEGVLKRQGKPTDHAFIHLPSEGLPRVVITTDHGAAYVDAQGRYDSLEAHTWTEFVLFLHYYPHLPLTWGDVADRIAGRDVCVCGDRHIGLPAVIMLGTFAAVLFYGDAIITSAISVLSAVEGFRLPTNRVVELGSQVEI